MDTVKVETEEYLEHHVNKETLPSNSQLAVLKPKEEYEFHKDECFSYSDQVKTEIEFDNAVNDAEKECLSETFKYDPNSINHNQYLNELKQEINEQQECNDALCESEVTLDEQKNNVKSCIIVRRSTIYVPMDTVKVETEEYLEHHMNKETLPSNSQLAVLNPKEEYEFHKDECFSYSDQVKTEIEFDNEVNDAEKECLSETFKYDPNSIHHNQYLNELKQEINEQQEYNNALCESEVTLDEQKNNVESWPKDDGAVKKAQKTNAQRQKEYKERLKKKKKEEKEKSSKKTFEEIENEKRKKRERNAQAQRECREKRRMEDQQKTFEEIENEKRKKRERNAQAQRECRERKRRQMEDQQKTFEEIENEKKKKRERNAQAQRECRQRLKKRKMEDKQKTFEEIENEKKKKRERHAQAQRECRERLKKRKMEDEQKTDPTLLETSGREKLSVNVASVSSVEQDSTTQFKRRVKPLSDSAAHIANFPHERNEQDDVQISVDLTALNSPDENCHLTEIARIYSTGIKKRRRKCAFCDYIPVDEVDFKNHGILVHNQFVCSKCRFSTPLEFCLKRHVSLEHSDVNGDQSIKQPGKCKFCDFSSSDKDEMSIHMSAFHLKIKQHECPSCDYVIGRLEDLKKHIQYVHRQKKDEKYLKCPSCVYRTSKKSMLKSHVEAFHPDVKDRECRICGFRTLLKHELLIHFRTEHSEKETYKCISCDYTGLTERELEFHVNVVHVRLKEHKCHLCNFASTRKRYLMMHVRYVHLKQRQYECSLCQFKTNIKIRLQLHNASVHSKSKNLKCESCGYEMAEKIELDIHVRSCKYKSQTK